MQSQHERIRDLALDNLRHRAGDTLPDLGQALLDALVEAGVDLQSGPSPEEVKQLLCEVAHAARGSSCRNGCVVSSA